ncbi:MAG: MoaD/ThiS family protein [Pirellulales bacterium]
MKVRVKLFAVAKELAGRDALVVDLPDGATIADLRQAVVETFPALAMIVPHSLWAIGSEYVDDNTQLNEKSDVALIPPVSGG